MARVIHTEEAIDDNAIDFNVYPQGYIVSHQGYGDDYDDNIASSLKLVNINYQNLTLDFISWDLQERGCSDYLQVLYLNSPERFCGDHDPGTIFISNATEMLLTFITDRRHKGNGFILFYRGKGGAKNCIICSSTNLS